MKDCDFVKGGCDLRLLWGPFEPFDDGGRGGGGGRSFTANVRKLPPCSSRSMEIAV